MIEIPLPSASQPASQQLATQVLRQFRLVFGEVRQHFIEVERRVGIGGTQLWALSEFGRSREDRRNVLLQLTDAGATLLRNAPGPHEGVLPAALQQLPPDTLRQLHQHLGTLLQVLDPASATARTPLAEL